jgi:hypothetical protein
MWRSPQPVFTLDMWRLTFLLPCMLLPQATEHRPTVNSKFECAQTDEAGNTSQWRLLTHTINFVRSWILIRRARCILNLMRYSLVTGMITLCVHRLHSPPLTFVLLNGLLCLVLHIYTINSKIPPHYREKFEIPPLFGEIARNPTSKKNYKKPPELREIVPMCTDSPV